MNPGKLSENVMKRSVYKYIKLNQEIENEVMIEKGAAVGADCALFSHFESSLGTAVAVEIDRDREVIKKAMIKASNNLWAEGVRPTAVQLSIVLPEAVFESELRHMMEEAVLYCNQHAIHILGGHTMVSQEVEKPVVTASLIGEASDYRPVALEPGMQIVVSKWIALEGSSKLAKEKKVELEARLPKRLLDRVLSYDGYMSIEKEAKIAIEHKVCAMHDISGGGIFRALWELGEAAEVGLRVEMKKIPVKQESIEVCEVFGDNPYEMDSSGSLLMVTKSAKALVEQLEAEGIYATVVGEITDNNDKILYTKGQNEGEARFIDRP